MENHPRNFSLIVLVIIVGFVIVFIIKDVQGTISLAENAQPDFFCRFEKKWGGYGAGDGQFKDPYSIAADYQGNVYVVDSVLYNNSIQKFDLNGNFLLKWKVQTRSFEKAMGIAADNHGNVYVTTYIIGNLYSTIRKFDSVGNPLLNWTVQSSSLEHIDVDNQGNIYVVDKGFNNGNASIIKFNSNGTFMLKWGGEKGIEDGQFIGPQGIAVNNNYVYVSDNWWPFSGTKRYDVQKFDSQGNFIKKFTGFNYPAGIEVDHLGRLYVVNALDKNVKILNDDGDLLNTFGSNGNEDGQFMRPSDIAIGFNNAYITDRGNYNVHKFECSILPIRINHCLPNSKKNEIEISPTTCQYESALEVV